MIDFNNAAFFKLKKVNGFADSAAISPLFVPGEEFIAQYTALRDYVIFTNKRIIAVNVQGLTGKKKDYTSLPYAKIQAFSIETAGFFDLDSELELYFSGLGKVKFEFVDNKGDLIEIEKLIAQYVLNK